MQTNPPASPRSAKSAELRELGAKVEHRPMMAELYRRAEAQLRKRRKSPKPAAESTLSGADSHRQFHELEVHRIELEMQNAELQASRERTEALLEKYTDLYDFAPVGYFTVSSDATIRQVNLTGARLTGIERARLVGQSFGSLVSPPLRPAFNAFLQQVCAGQTSRSGDFVLSGKGQPTRWVNIEARRALNGQECRVVMVDITERKAAEDKLRVSEVRYRRLFEAAHDGVLLIDPGTRKITDANPFMTQLLGYPHDQLVGMELFEIGLLQDETASQDMFTKLKREHQVRYEDLPLESEKGRHQEVEVVANLYQENGHSVIQCNIRDITERKQAEMALNRLAAIVEFSDDAMIGKDPNGIITSWNNGAERIFGYTAREMVGTSIMRLIPADRRDEEKLILEKVRGGEGVQHFETKRQTKDRRLINVSLTISPIKNIAGEVIGISKVARDISERKAAEDALRRNEALFSALIEQAPYGVYVVDADFRLQQVNRKAQPVFRKVRPVIGRDLSEVLQILWPRRVADDVVSRFRKTLKTGEPYQSPEFAARRRDTGVKENYEWQIQRVTLPDGEFGVVCFFNDITERKRAEETQRRMDVLTASNQKLELEIVRRHEVEQSLKKSDKHQSLLLAQSLRMEERLRQLSRQVLRAQEEERKRISRELHDVIAQTLTGINVRLANLKQEAVFNNKGLDRSIARTQLMVERAVDIVHRFARELRPAVLDDLGLIPALHTHVRNLQKETGIRVSLSAFAAVEQISGDKRTVLYRVAQEALTNVARHAKASRVEVAIQKVDRTVCLEIKDNGRGFRGERVLQSGKNRRLGLLGMKERLEMVGGAFALTSEPGKGTIVRAQIPLDDVRPRVARGGVNSLNRSAEIRHKFP